MIVFRQTEFGILLNAVQADYYVCRMCVCFCILHQQVESLKRNCSSTKATVCGRLLDQSLGRANTTSMRLQFTIQHLE